MKHKYLYKMIIAMFNHCFDISAIGLVFFIKSKKIPFAFVTNGIEIYFYDLNLFLTIIFLSLALRSSPVSKTICSLFGNGTARLLK